LKWCSWIMALNLQEFTVFHWTAAICPAEYIFISYVQKIMWEPGRCL